MHDLQFMANHSRSYFVLLALCVFVLSACSSDADQTNNDQAKSESTQTLAPLVVSVAVQRAGKQYPIQAEGFLRPVEQIQIVSEVTGIVESKSPQLYAGGRIAEGEVLFELEKRTYQAERDRAAALLQSAEVARSNAATNLQRQTRLSNLQSTSEAAQDEAKTNLAAAVAREKEAKAALVLADERLQDSSIRAPFDAAVMSENISVGAYVSVGQSVAEIFDVTSGEIIVGVAQSKAADIINHMQQEDAKRAVNIYRNTADKKPILTGQIVAVEPQLDKQARTVNFRIQIPQAFTQGDGLSAPLIEEYLMVVLTAESQQPLYSAPQGVLREERFVYQIDNDNVLKRINVKPVSRMKDEVLFIIESEQTLEQPENLQLLLTNLPEEYEGLSVRVEENKRNVSADSTQISTQVSTQGITQSSTQQ